MAFIYLSGGYVINVSGTRGETANRLSNLSPENPFVGFRDRGAGHEPGGAGHCQRESGRGDHGAAAAEQPLAAAFHAKRWSWEAAWLRF